MKPLAFFDRRIRGFRVVELGGAAVLLVLILVVYLAKTGAGGKRADIDRVQDQINAEQTDIRLLKAEVATLEQPERLEALSAQYLNLQPISVKHEIQPEALGDLARMTSEPGPSPAAKSASPIAAATTAPKDVIIPLTPPTVAPVQAAKPVQAAASAKAQARPKVQLAANRPHPGPPPASIDAAIEAAQSPAGEAPPEGGR